MWPKHIFLVDIICNTQCQNELRIKYVRHSARMSFKLIGTKPNHENESGQMGPKKWYEHNLMYIYHKQCEIMQKFQWNSSNGQLHWFPFDFLWKWSIMDQNYANANASRHVANFFKRYPDMPYESWRPGDSKNVVVCYSITF